MSRDRGAVFVLLGLIAGGVAPALAADRPAIVAQRLDGTRFDLAGERGHVVIINFWATWCAPCRAELPALDDYYRSHRREGVAMLAIALDADGARRKLARATRGFAFPVARIADTRIARADIPRALPATLIYARDGTLRYDSRAPARPPLDAGAIARIVGPLLAEPPSPIAGAGATSGAAPPR